MKRRSFIQNSLALGSLVGADLLLPHLAFAASPVKVGLMIPMSGPAGLFGPSSKNCGELAVADHDVQHRPRAEGDEDCICLAVTDGALRFTDTLGRMARDFFTV